MGIITYTTPLLEQNMYIIVERNNCIVIDPYYDDKVKTLLENMSVDLLLVTHEHYDHIEELVFKSQIAVLAEQCQFGVFGNSHAYDD